MAQLQNKETTPLLPNQVSVTDRLRSMCAPWCSCTRLSLTRRRCGQNGPELWFLKSKAVVLVLFWNMVVLLMFQPALEPDIIVSFVYDIVHPRPVLQRLSYSLVDILYSYQFSLALVIYGLAAFLLLFFPLGGFLADVCFGRFKILQCSLWNLWVSAIFAICGSVSGIIIAIKTADPYDIIPPSPQLPWLFGIIVACTFGTVCVSLIVSYVLFSANVIQFGLDQLQDYPASDSSLFVYWFVWMYHLVLCLYKFSANLISCPKQFNDFYDSIPVSYYSLLIVLGIILLLGYIALPVTLCLIRHRRFRRWFIIEPGAHNPYKLVYNVLKFAAKHDHPIQRSAFTYCEDELPSRLDLGKSKYGGPFTTEEVENVKSFGGIVRVLLTLGPIFIVEMAASGSLSTFYFHLSFKVNINESDFWVDPFNNKTYYDYPVRPSSVASCIFFLNTRAVSSAIIVIVIPLYIILLRPYLRCNFFGTLKRLGVAIVLFTLSLLISFTIDTVGHSEDHNASCMFRDKYIYDFFVFIGSGDLPEPLSSINSHIVAIQAILNAFAIVLFYTSAYEFICAQSPHSMKGLIIGTFFAINGLFKFIGVAAFFIPFEFYSIDNKHVPWLSCGFIYYVLNILIAIIAFVIYTLVARGYHYRQRDEPSNIRQFVENYYENLQDEPGYDYDDTDEHEVYSVR